MISTMTTTFTSRSILLALGLGFVLATACFDESVLENEECGSNADCAKNQACVQTGYQATATTMAYGWCRPKGELCDVGSQPGCECLLTGSLYSCVKNDTAEFNVCPSSQDTDCTCVFPTDLDPPLTSNTDTCPTST
jgi:hypothetical protein